MKSLGIRVGLLLCALAATAPVTGCSSDADKGQQEQTGIVSLRLTAQTNGNTYRLRNGLFNVAGPTNAVLDSKVDPDAQELHARLSSGNYSIDLQDGWSLERLDGGVFEAVDAMLISPNPKSFEVLAGETTNVAYQFSTNGQIVSVGVGDLTVSLSVVENGNGGGGPDPSCNDGIQNGDEEGVDCGGSVCVPCGVSECSPATHQGCNPGDACYLIDFGNGAGQCQLEGGVPIGQPCTAIDLNECQGGGICADLGSGLGQICNELCDVILNNCSNGLFCSETNVPGVGVCF